MNHASTSGVITIIFSSPQGPDRLWGHSNLLFNGYRGAFAESIAAREWRLKWTHLRLNKVKRLSKLISDQAIKDWLRKLLGREVIYHSTDKPNIPSKLPIRHVG